MKVIVLKLNPILVLRFLFPYHAQEVDGVHLNAGSQRAGLRTLLCDRCGAFHIRHPQFFTIFFFL